MTRTRKTPKSWIDAGLAALKKEGPESVKAESLARALGTTKGSFYWHFKDVPTFQKTMIASWLDNAIGRFDTHCARADSEIAQLRSVGTFTISTTDRAMRAWAVHNAAARKAVVAYDAHVTAKIAGLLAAQGATHPDFPKLVHAALVQQSAKSTQTETLIDLLLVLK